MKKPQRYLWMVVLLLVVCISYYAINKRHLDNSIVRQNFNVVLPQGGAIEYRNEFPKVRFSGPADTTKFLTWTKPNGSSQEYLISEIGGSYQDVEFRIRQDGRAVWLIAWDQKKIAATLDLNSGRVTNGGGVVYDADGQQNESAQPSLPKWATMKGGRSLGRKKF